MSKLLMLVHGMGSYPPGWSDSVVKRLDAVAAQYGEFAAGPAFSDRCTIAEIRYDNVFERLIDEWEADATKFDQFRAKQGVALPKLMPFLTGGALAADEEAILWSTLMDAILYRAFPIVRDEVRAAVMAQIVGHTTANMRAGAVDASILAHSLGTAVVHDTLQLLASTPQLGNASFTAGAGWHFDKLFMLADVCRLGPPALIDLKDSAADYLVRPRSAGKPGDTATFYCNTFCSFRHEFDPFVRWSPFVPDWGADFTNPTPLSAIHQLNVHGFDHYLENPDVHIPIINGVMGFSAISRKEALDARTNYPAIGSAQCSAQVDSLKKFVTALPDAGKDIEQAAMLGVKFFATAKQLARDCKSLGGDLGV